VFTQQSLQPKHVTKLLSTS